LQYYKYLKLFLNFSGLEISAQIRHEPSKAKPVFSGIFMPFPCNITIAFKNRHIFSILLKNRPVNIQTFQQADSALQRQFFALFWRAFYFFYGNIFLLGI